jgi:hypothetical protein
MVDALRNTHRALARGGLLVDARPDSRVLARVEHVRGKTHRSIGTIKTARAELANDTASDRAIARVVREGLFAHGKRGRFWHRVPFDDLAAMVQYLKEHLRFEHRAKWSVSPAERRRIKDEPFTIRRAIRYELLKKL